MPSLPPPTPPRPIALARMLDLTAPGFIVTIYGDVVVPRGGVLSMAALIEICAGVGFGENQVRTAVSRLVAGGRLEGDRQGRRSFYRLADAAHDEFGQAAARLYATDPVPRGWMLLTLDDTPEEVRRAFHLAPVGGACWLAPDQGALPPGARLVLRGHEGPGLAAFFDLAPVAARYDRLIAGFADLSPAGEGALILRLLLVHAYRGALLRDPLLPAGQLPEGWSGARARALFRDLYLRLTPGAEVQIAGFDAIEGPLPARTPESDSRINRLRGAAS